MRKKIVSFILSASLPFGMGMASMTLATKGDQVASVGKMQVDTKNDAEEGAQPPSETSTTETPVLAAAAAEEDRPRTPTLPEPTAYEFVDPAALDLLPVGEWQNLCTRVTPLVSAGTHVQKVQGPAMIIGDLHGDYAAANFYCQKFEELFRAGECRSVVFLGDYVDRGQNSLKVVETLFRLKTNYPGQVCLLRGNHEDKFINNFGPEINPFGSECRSKYGNADGKTVMDAVNKVFDCLPLTAVIDGKTFCVHGGPSAYSRQSSTSPCPLKRIERIRRIGEADGFVANNLLWNNYNPSDFSFEHNSEHRSRYRYGNVAVDEFLRLNNLELIVRAHDHNHAMREGGGMTRDHSGRIITMLGVPDYIHQYYPDQPRNNGCAIIVSGSTIVDIIELKHRP